MTWIHHQGVGAFNNTCCRCIMIPHTQRAKNFPYLTSKAVPSPEQVRLAQQDMFFSCCGVEWGYSTHLPHPERMRPKTRLPSSKSEQPQRKKVSQKAGCINCGTWPLISASAEVRAGSSLCTSDIPRRTMCTGSAVFQETGHITVPPPYMQPLHGAVQKWWAPLACAKLYVTSRLTTFRYLSNKFQSELVN